MPVSYTHLETVVDTIMEIITKGFDARGLKRPMVLVEPGRYCVGNAGITLYTVGSSKYIKDIRDYITVDGGMTDNLSLIHILITAVCF